MIEGLNDGHDVGVGGSNLDVFYVVLGVGVLSLLVFGVFGGMALVFASG